MSINKTNHKKSQNQEMNENINNLIIKDYISQNESLKSHISDLESQIRELKSHITELGNRNLALIEYEQENVSLNTETKQLKQTITDLEQEIISTLKKGKEEAREVATELENEVSYYKRIADSVKGKIEAAEYIIHLNSIQHNYILKLEKELEDIKINNKMHINEIKVEHDLHYKHLKHKMIDIIKKSNKEIQKENITNIEIHSKFSAINKGEILDELEKQNIQIIQLIRENEEKDKQILNLTQEKQSYYSVNKLLKKKNLKLSKLIGNFIEKQEQNETKNNEDKNKSELKNLLFKTTMTKRQSPKSQKLQEKYNNLLYKYNILNEKLEHLIDKDKSFQKKYYGIIKLYDTALKELIKEDNLNVKKMEINIDKFIEGKIESYSKEDKIKIVSLLIKQILPLIKSQSNEIIKLRNLFNKMDIKVKINSDSTFYSRNQNSNTIKLLYEIKQFTSDLDYSLRKEEQFISKNKSIFNTYNNTYNNINHNNIHNLINSKEESKSIKSSFFGPNINTSAIKKKKESKLDGMTNTNNNNRFMFSAFNFYKPNNVKRKFSGIKLYKKDKLRDELMDKKNPLYKNMFLKDIKTPKAFNNEKIQTKCLTENNYSPK